MCERELHEREIGRSRKRERERERERERKLHERKRAREEEAQQLWHAPQSLGKRELLLSGPSRVTGRVTSHVTDHMTGHVTAASGAGPHECLLQVLGSRGL